MWSIMHTYTPLLALSLPPLPLAHSRAPLSSHHPLYSRLPASFPSLLSSFCSLRHLFSHSIMLLLDAFSFSHFTHIHFPSPRFLPSPFIFLPFSYLPYLFPSPLPSKPAFNFPFPISLLISPPSPWLFLPFSSLVALFLLSLWSLTYLFGADIVVFMRAASPTAAEGRPHNLALVAALGLVRQTDIWTETNRETNKLTDRGT